MMSHASACGFYGKLLGTGDFVRRDFPADLYARWDSWLQQGLQASRAELGEDWLEAYLSAPIWRFALAPGLAGASAWVGAMMPSVDRVGRYFPLTVIAASPPAASLFSLARAAESWLQAIEQPLLDSLDGPGLGADAFAQRLRAVDCKETVHDDDHGAELIARQDSLAIHAPRDAEVEQITRAFADTLAAHLLGDPLSLWWSAGSNRVAPGARLHAGLPQAGDFRRLLHDDVVPPAPESARS